MDNNRTILAVVLIVLLWSGYSLFFTPQRQVQQVAVVEKVTQETPTEPAVAPVVAASDTTGSDLIVNNNQEESFLTVSSDYYEVKMSTVGATVRSIVLKKYNKTNNPDSELYTLFYSDNFELSTLKASGSDGLYIPANLSYKLLDKRKKIEVNDENIVVSFVASINDLIIVKTFTFYPSSYSFDLNIQLTNNSHNPVNGKLSLSLITPWDKDDKSRMYTFVGPVTYDGEDLSEDKPGDLDKSPRIYKNNIIWSGYASKYFLNAISPQDSSEQLYITSGLGFVENKFTSAQISLLTEQKTSFNYSSYFGPKEDEFLLAGGHQFEEAIHYGFFHPLSKPLMVVLKFFYGFIGNYGFSIILLTFCIKLIFWPLTQKSYKSMKGMQKLQPEMKKMREKHGKDKQKLNQEMMSFYKENKVNPLGGCLPMVIQIPVFFALYRVLLGSIELRHAPFMLWITDLSAKDPYYVTPLIMGVTMFLQQKMTPTNMDPTQEKIMLMMPVVFTFMFLNFPSGLVLYWLTNNLLTILQQYLIRRQPD
ncbi:MAG: membrane protein insertase YidC [Desulfuromusa sp.]|jgi:YidC/Oxa1 family membrane protein insertase|nr:membrane protein insertase YidC [Desulfuromusa sp.]